VVLEHVNFFFYYLWFEFLNISICFFIFFIFEHFCILTRIDILHHLHFVLKCVCLLFFLNMH